MGMSLRQAPMMECSCCSQLMIAERRTCAELDSALFGTSEFAVCPVCQQEVTKENQTDEYKKKWLDIKQIRGKMREIELEFKHEQERKEKGGWGGIVENLIEKLESEQWTEGYPWENNDGN